MKQVIRSGDNFARGTSGFENVLNSVVTLFPQRCKKALVSYEKLLPYLLSRFGKNPKEYGFGW